VGSDEERVNGFTQNLVYLKFSSASVAEKLCLCGKLMMMFGLD